MSRNSRSPGCFDLGTVILRTLCCLALPITQYSQGMYAPCNCSLKALAVDLVLTLLGYPSLRDNHSRV